MKWKNALFGGDDIDDDAKKEKIDAMKLKINRMGTSIMMIQYLTKYCFKMVLFKMSCVSIYNTIINKAAEPSMYFE